MNENLFLSQNLRFLLSEQKERFEKLDLGYSREVLTQVGSYLKSPHALVITGLRRSGKSILQAQLARQYLKGNYYYLNFDDERWVGFKSENFSQVHETLIELFGEKKYFLMDEIQNIAGWELFARRLQDQGYQLIVTGSNARLLSQEIGTHLTGRYRTIELFPFSFTECLGLAKIDFPAKTTVQSAKVKRALRHYLEQGGIPDALKYPEGDFCAQLYQDILYRDISARYSIDSLKNLKELSLFLVSNAGRAISFNKLKQMLMLGSVNTIKTYIEYLESSWLYFTINLYSSSVKQQQIAPKKVYCIDNGIINQIAFRSSDDLGWLLENAVFLHLRRRTHEIFYAKNDDGSEVDFLVRRGTKPVKLIQVAAFIRQEASRKRELKALFKAMEQYRLKEGFLITLDEAETICEGKQIIHVVSAVDWLSHEPSNANGAIA